MAIEIQGPSLVDGATRVTHVSPDNRLMVASKSNVRGFFVSRDDKRLFNAVFNDTTAAAGGYIAYIKNTSSSRNMYIDLVRLWSTTASVWLFVKATGTATGGTSVTAVNMNFGSGIEPEATLLQDNIGGFTAGTAFADGANVANTSLLVPFDDTLILGPGNAFAIERDVAGATDRASATVRFFYEDLETQA